VRLAAGAGVVVVVAAVAIVLSRAGGGGSDGPLLMTTSVKTNDAGVAIPRSFLGVSTEWPSVSNRTGTPATGPNKIYDQLIDNLTAQGDGPPTLRVGGDYQDYAWWNPSGAPRPGRLGVSVDITPAILEGLALNAKATGQRMILGVNLEANSPALARAEAAAFVRYVPLRDILGLEIGNEPDYYSRRLLYSERIDGKSITVPVRPPGWNAAEYLREFDRVASAIRGIRGDIPLAGPAGAGVLPTAWQFLRHEHGRVALYTQHAYPLSTCPVGTRPATLADPTYPTISRLLGDVGTNAMLPAELRGLRAAQTWHVPMQLTEINSTGCQPPPQIGNSFAAGLWALDQFLLDTAIGIRGVNLHMDDMYETPFGFGVLRGSGVAVVTPLYYAMLMYADAVRDGGWLELGPSFRERHPTSANIRSWVIRGRDGTLRIVVINKDLRQSGTVRIGVQSATAAASLIRFDAGAPGRTGAAAEVGGQWIPFATRTGRLQGTPRQTAVALVGGSYTFELERLTAAILTVPGIR